MRQRARFIGRSTRINFSQKIRSSATDSFLVEVRFIDQSGSDPPAGAFDLRRQGLVEGTSCDGLRMKHFERL